MDIQSHINKLKLVRELNEEFLELQEVSDNIDRLSAKPLDRLPNKASSKSSLIESSVTRRESLDAAVKRKKIEIQIAKAEACEAISFLHNYLKRQTIIMIQDYYIYCLDEPELVKKHGYNYDLKIHRALSILSRR